MHLCAACGKSVLPGKAACPECGGTIIPEQPQRHQQALYSAGHVLEGRFRVEKVLGSGASGVVYGVHDGLLKRRSALKVLWEASPENSPAFERLRREIRAAQKVQSPHLVTIYDLLVLDGRPTLLMEWVEGENLRERVQRTGPLPPEEAVDIASAILVGLSRLHAEGVLHRDIKSGNILLPSEGGAKLGDLGLAKAEDMSATLTATGATLGTPGYMAPEVIRGEAATPRSDLYGVGVVLFEMLTGRMPFSGNSALEIASKHLNTPPPLALLKQHRVPRWLRGLTARLLEKDSRDRYSTAEATLDALKLRSWGVSLNRRGRVAALAGLAILLVTGSLGLSLGTRVPRLDARFHGKTLEVYNGKGRLLWTKEMPRAIQSVCTGRFSPGAKPAVACALEWGEGTGASFSAQGRLEEGANRLLFFDADGTPRLDLPYTVQMRTGLSNHFRLDLAPLSLKPGSQQQLAVFARHMPWYPSGISLYDFEKAGAGFSSYAALHFGNSGHIQLWKPWDLDGDGNQEIVFTAMNNRLYKSLVVGALNTTDIAMTGGWVVSPDSPQWRQGSGRLRFYRLVQFGFHKDCEMREGEGGLGIFFQSHLPLWIRPSGELVQEGEKGNSLSSAAAAEAADLIAKVCEQRDAEAWDAMRAKASRLPEDGATYSWLKALFTADAQIGQGKYNDAVAGLDESLLRLGAEDRPPYESQFRVNALFLSGNLPACIHAIEESPANSLLTCPEIRHTLALALLTAEQPERADLPNFLDEMRYGYNAPLFEALKHYLSGDPAGADSVFRTLPGSQLDMAIFPLWQAGLLADRGRGSEALEIIERLDRRFPQDNIHETEEAIWARWRSGHRGQEALAQMQSLLGERRREAATQPEARAFLPFTLVRFARMQREMRNPAEAGKLEAEARRLAPKWWYKALGL